MKGTGVRRTGCVVVVLAVLAGAPYLYLRLGYLDLRADIKPTDFETQQASSFMDASTARHSPDVKNPLQPTDATLLAGMKLYRQDCAMCHGAPDHPEKRFGHPLYPPAPQFMTDPADMPANRNFYIVSHGVRWTGMPAWKDTLSAEQIWRIVTFIGRMDKLPPAVAKEWNAPGTSVTAAHAPAGH